MAIDIESVLSDAGATAPIKGRVETVLRFFKAATGQEPDDVIISEYVAKSQNEEQRVYTSVFLFRGNNLFYEAKNFLHETELDCHKLSQFGYWQLTSIKFGELTDATEHSRLTLKMSWVTDSRWVAIMRASGLNCNRLARIFKDRIRRVVGS